MKLKILKKCGFRTPRCCNEAAIMPNSSSDCSQNGQVNRRPVSSSGSGSRGRHTQREPCSNPERCRNIKKKLLYGSYFTLTDE